MKSKFANFIMSLVIILILAVIIIFGIIIFQEIQEIDTSVEVDNDNFQTVISDFHDTIDNNIETPKIIENPLNKIKDANTNVGKVDYSNIQIDRYFYNQLDEYSKIIYRAFESNKENMKTGTYKIELGSTFSSLLKEENGQDELQKYYQSAIEAYTYDNSSIFYLSPNKMYLNIETTTKGNNVMYNVYINNGNENNYLVDGFSSKEQIDSAINQIEQVKYRLVSNKSGNTYNDIKMVHDYLVDNFEYDSSLSRQNIYNIYGALVNNVCVCEGYARSFKYLMDEMGIPCVLVIGQGTNSQGQTENHAWNYVNVNGNWYAIDCTWDDPVIIGGGTASRESKYRYFLKGAISFNGNHNPNGQFTPGGKVFEYPVISSIDF